MKLTKGPGGDFWNRKVQNVFGGLSCSHAAGEGEIKAMKNMTSDHYPLLSPRDRRYTVRNLTRPHGLGGEDKLFWVDGTTFYYDGVQKGTVADSDKQFFWLNKWIVIFPDKKYYNTATDTFGSLEAEVSVDASVKFAHFRSVASPGGTSDTANCLELDATTVQHTFVAGEAVTISGCTTHPENNKTLVVRESVGTSLFFYDDSFKMGFYRLWEAGSAGLTAGDYNMIFDGEGHHAVVPAMTRGDTLVWYGGATLTATVGGELHTINLEDGLYGSGLLTFGDPVDMDYTEAGAVTVRRNVPDMDYLCQCDNRLWGVKGGSVYCSYLGNPKVWYNYDSTASACWSVETGGGGAFTGAYTYGGYPLLFKENHIYRVYGTKPSSFQLMETETLGCETGSHKSFAVVGQTLYYKSRAGFVAYAGGVPSLVDEALGTARRQNAVAGTDGRKYYVSVTTGQSRDIYVYDTLLGLWHREDSTDVKDYVWCGGELYMLTAAGDILLTGRIRTSSGTLESAPDSMVEFAPIWEQTIDRKLLKSIWLRVETDSELRLSVSWDGGSWQQCGCLTGGETGLQTFRVIPRRCDSFRLRLEGEGSWKLWALGREYAAGTTQG